MQIQCLKCKGRGFCGRNFCSILAKNDALFKVKQMNTKEEFLGSSPTPFVGHYGYPYLNVGILSVPELKEEVWEYDAPRYWANNDFQIPQIIDFRSQLLNSRFKAHAQDKNKLLDISQEIGMASKPVELEVNLEDKPKFKLNTDAYTAPTGPNAGLKNAQITSNPKIHTKVDKVVSDIDLKANDALLYLYENEFDENFLTRLFSIGTLGLRKNRKLVPTRWSISSVDSNIGNHLVSKIKEYNQTNYLAFFGGYLGNYFLILCFPEIYSYELFESYMAKSSWNISNKINYTTDYEPYEGRKTYAENCGGGFYACRIALLEKLNQIKKQASVLVIRSITGEYAVPLGVWVVREGTRKALENKPIEFSSRELMLKYAQNLIKKKFGYDIKHILNKSIILNNLKTQMKLNAFI